MRYVLALVLVAPLALPFLTAAQNQHLAFEVASIRASRLGRTVDARLAISWAFNIPRGWWGQWQHLSPALFTYLHFFQMLTLALIAVTLLKPERKIILFGLAWFWIAVLPALPIATHFVPHYLFVPIVGLSILVGIVFSTAYNALRSIQPLCAAAASIVIVFAGVLYVNSRSIRGDIRDNRILGGSAKLAADTLTDLKLHYPTLPAEDFVLR